MANQLLFAFIISVVIVGLAYWRNSLSRSGAVGALLVGFLTFGFGGWQCAGSDECGGFPDRQAP